MAAKRSATPSRRTYSPPAKHALVLRPDYVDRAQRVGAAQIAAAGNRIGALLLGVR